MARSLYTLAAVVCAVCASAAVGTGPATAPAGRLFVDADVSVAFGAKDPPPMLVVGQMPPGVGRQPADAAAINAITGDIAGPRQGTPTWAWITSPVLNTGESFRIAEVRRSKPDEPKAITLLCETFTDNGPREKNAPARHVRAVCLGDLPQGEYDLRIEWRHLFRDFQNGAWGYALRDTRVASGPISVAGPTAQAGERVMIRTDQLKALPAPIAGQHERRPATVFLPPHPMRPAGQIPRDAALFDVGVVAGEDPAKLVPPPAGVESVLARITCPVELNSYEWMTLRQIRWEDNVSTLVVDLWRDSGERAKNIPHTPTLLVNVHLPATQHNGQWRPQAGQYTFRIEWSPLRAPAPGGIYLPEDAQAARALSDQTPPVRIP